MRGVCFYGYCYLYIFPCDKNMAINVVLLNRLNKGCDI